MKGVINLWADTVVAEAAITDRAAVVQGTAEKQGKIAPSTNATKVKGLATQAQATAGKTCSIQRKGIAEGIAAGKVDIGDYVITSGALGRLESLGTLSVGIGSIKYIVGQAESAASVAGDIFEVNLNPELISVA